MKPYYERSGITIYHADCRDVLPTLSGLQVTDWAHRQWTTLAMMLGRLEMTLEQLHLLSDALHCNPGAIVRGQVFELRPIPIHEKRRPADVRQKVSKLKTARERGNA